MDKKKIEKIVYGLICVALLAVLIVLFAGAMKNRNETSAPENDKKKEADSGKKLFDDVLKVEETVTINTQIIEDGLREMGQLITEEYYFTQVEEYSSSKKILIFDSKASFVYSYDGVVSAGIDCNDVKIDKDDEAKKITIHIPAAEIYEVSIDYDSFKIFEEKEGLWNKTNISNYNDSLVEFEKAARSKALEKGIIDKADEGARKMIESFVNSIVDTEDYTIEYDTASSK